MYNIIFIFHGLLSILAQLIIFRELSVLFYGSELFLGTFLSSWLFWVGLGSLLINRLVKRKYPLEHYFSYSFLVLCVMLPFVIFIIRISKNLFSFGEFIGPVGTMLFTFIIMSFFCLILGSQFSLGCAIVSNTSKKEAALGRVYLYETLGSVLGGVLFTYILIGSVSTFAIAQVLSLGCLLVGWIILKRVSRRGKLLVTIALVLLLITSGIEPVVNRAQWKGYQLIEQRQTRNAIVSFVKMGSVKNVFVDGMISATFPNAESYEPVAHWPLLSSKNPNNILVLGDLSLGTLKEVLKHNPQLVDFVVFDTSIIDLILPYLDTEDRAALSDSRIHINYGDSRFFIKKKKNAYDVVIINIEEVPNLKLNRFYTQEFYSQIKSALNPDGILALSVRSSENFLSQQTRIFNASVFDTLHSVFEYIEIIPGDSITLLCSSTSIDLREETIIERLQNRGISNHYFVPSYISYKLIPERRRELRNILEQTPGVEINRDFRPTTYTYFLNSWLNKFTSPLKNATTVALFIGIIFIIFKRKRSLFLSSQRKECILIFVLGFIGIALELILLLSFQIISGYVYWQMGILFASFMTGLCLGGALGIQSKVQTPNKNFNLLVILALVLVGLSVSISSFIQQLANLSAIVNICIFMVLLIVIGIIVGAAFVVASFLISVREPLEKAGSLYAADLWGAASGALLTTNFIVPTFGLLGSLRFCAIAGLVGLVAFFVLSKNNKQA